MWDLLYRPQRYADVLGQAANAKILKARIKNGTAYDISYIFAGGYGRGKTTLARIHARAMLCQDLDKHDPEPCNVCDNCRRILEEQPGAFTERDAASINGVEAARALVDELPYVLEDAPKRIYLLDEAHRMTAAAQDVLLKPIEDKRMIGMFCTTEVEKLRSAIRSRCETYIIGRVASELIVERVKQILDEHTVYYEPEALQILVDKADGHVRDVLISLESLAQAGSITVEQVRIHLNLPVVAVYYETLLALDDPKAAFELVDKALERVSPSEVCAGLAEAAMNCHKLAQKIPVDHSLVDQPTALRVYEKYGDAVLGLVEWFLRESGATKSGLFLRVTTALTGKVPKPQYEATTVTVPVPVALQAAVASPVTPAAEPAAVSETFTAKIDAGVKVEEGIDPTPVVGDADGKARLVPPPRRRGSEKARPSRRKLYSPDEFGDVFRVLRNKNKDGSTSE